MECGTKFAEEGVEAFVGEEYGERSGFRLELTGEFTGDFRGFCESGFGSAAKEAAEDVEVSHYGGFRQAAAQQIDAPVCRHCVAELAEPQGVTCKEAVELCERTPVFGGGFCTELPDLRSEKREELVVVRLLWIRHLGSVRFFTFGGFSLNRNLPPVALWMRGGVHDRELIGVL